MSATVFEDMTAGEIVDWLRNAPGFSRNQMHDDILPVLRRKIAILEEDYDEGDERRSWECKLCGWEGEQHELVGAECGTFRCPDCLKHITLGEEDGEERRERWWERDEQEDAS